jgi:two-component system, OmpR family, sensor histidine kinase BaeS
LNSRLFYKFFFLFLFTSIFVVLFMVAVLQFSVHRNFTDYVAQMELVRLDKLIYALEKEYKNNGNWDALRQNEHLWHELIITYVPDRVQPFGHPPFRPETNELLKNEPIQPDQDPNKRKKMPEDDRRPPHGPLWDNGEWRPQLALPPPPSRLPPFLAIGPRLSLLDAKKNVIFGDPDLSEQILRVIEIDGQAVGWLGIKKPGQLTNPADILFLKQQSQAFYLIGTMVLILAMIVSVLFSRHLLAPVRKIAEGTKALRHRRFNTRILVSTSDELGQLAEDFNVMAQHLETYETMRRQWLSDISHELRTPLTVLQGEIEALQDGILEPSPEAIASLHAEVIYLRNIVNDLHRISQMESGTLEMIREPINPIEILKHTLERFEHRLNQQQIDINSNLEESDKIRIMGDADRISQVFSNILENILRYASSPGVVKVEYVASNNDITISIEDSGPGVPEESLEKLFDRFYRTDVARTRSKGGSGLGLAICKSIVEVHQGEISAVNGSSGGLKINIRFPLAK